MAKKMTTKMARVCARLLRYSPCLAAAFFASTSLITSGAFANEFHRPLVPGNLLVSRMIYDSDPDIIVPGQTKLPPQCDPADCVAASTDGTYPYVWNNSLVDDYFGVTSTIVLDQIRPNGALVSAIAVPDGSGHGFGRPHDGMVASFSSKSEGALNLSKNGRYVTFMGYGAPINALDISNSDTIGVVDPTNPDHQQNYRVAAALDERGHFHFTATNAYSGDNGRAVILDDDPGVYKFYAAGNAGNGSNPQPDDIIIAAGAQIFADKFRPLVSQSPGLPTPVGSFNITQLGVKADKIGKDTNFRGLTIFDNVLYLTKGSGSKGVNTLYFVDTSGAGADGKPRACPDGTGLPDVSATLPTAPIAYDPTLLQSEGVTPYNMCILKGFPTALKSKTFFPFGVWFANAKTVYVADEGAKKSAYDATTNTYTDAAAQTGAGLQKWIFDDTAGAWKFAYTLQAGLQLGVPYVVAGYPTGNNAATGLPWSPATNGLRNLTGRVNRDGTATIWAVSSTVSGNGDQGADPNKLVMITDDLAATERPAGEAFSTLRTAGFGEVLRGVSFTPGTRFGHHDAVSRLSGEQHAAR